VKLRFGEFFIDSDARQLLRQGTPVHLSRKAFDALCLLAERRPNAIAKDELHARLWPGTHVVDASLTVTIAEIRRALGDDPQTPRFIRTVHRIGYAFCAVTGDDLVERSTSGRAIRAWLAYGERVVPLGDGENVIGRDPASVVWLDESGVSRRHALLTLEGDAATIEDLGSKNGTWLDGQAVEGRRALADGNRLQVGPLTLEFRTSSRAADTETVRMDRGGRKASDRNKEKGDRR